MKYRLFTVAAFLSLAAFVGVGEMWIRGSRRFSGAGLTFAGRLWMVESQQGRLRAWVIPRDDIRSLQRGQNGGWGELGFDFGAFAAGKDARATAWRATVPCWLALLAAAPLPWVWVAVTRRRLRARRRVREGRCAACGYDLRESAGRCPECGAMSATQR